MKLAIVGAGFMADIIAKRARSLNITTYCFAWEKGAVAKDSVDYFYPVSVLEKETILEICRENNIDGIIAGASISIATTAYVAEQLHLLGNSVEIASNIGNKYYVREKTKAVNSLGQIKYAEVKTVDEIKRLGFSYPIILKPTNSGGKDGVVFVNDDSELEDAFCYSTNGHEKVIVEEYIEGKEYSVESLSYCGNHFVLQITEKVNSGPPHFVELAHHQPADLNESIVKKIRSVMNDVFAAVGIMNGPCHSEIKVKGDEVFLIEINGRLGGDHISYPLTELSTGYPYITGVIQAALGILEPIDISKYKGGYASVFFVTKQTECLKEIFDNCQNEQWCYEKHFESNDLIWLEKNNGFRINYFIYYSDSAAPIWIKDIMKKQLID